MKEVSYFVLGLLWTGCIHGKIITNTSIWDANTHIYHLNTKIKERIQIIEFKPNGIALEMVGAILISLPKDIDIIQDVEILFKEVPILLALTVTGQLVGINLVTKEINFILQLRSYFGARGNFFGALNIGYGQNGSENIVITVNAGLVGVALIELPQGKQLLSSIIEKQLRIILASSPILSIVSPVKIVMTEQNKRIFARIKTVTGSSIWELNLDNIHLSKIHDMTVYPSKGFIMLDLQQQQNVNAIAMFGSKFLKIIPYIDLVQKTALPSYNIPGENILDVIIGPAMIEPFLSWYIVEKNKANYLLRSNNFANVINLPRHRQLFIRHGELVLHSLDNDKLFAICCRTGKLQKLTVIKQWGMEFDGNTAEEGEDFLFWVPKLKQHILLSMDPQVINIKAFELSFDKPKILSWRKEIMEDI